MDKLISKPLYLKLKWFRDFNKELLVLILDKYSQNRTMLLVYKNNFIIRLLIFCSVGRIKIL